MSLVDEVQGMFHVLSGYDELESQVSIWCHLEHLRRSEQPKEWRAVNPERFASAVERWQAMNPDKVQATREKWLAKKPDDECRQCSEKAVTGRRLCEAHGEANRKRWHARKGHPVPTAADAEQIVRRFVGARRARTGTSRTGRARRDSLTAVRRPLGMYGVWPLLVLRM